MTVIHDPILLTGVTGQVGGELLPLLKQLGPVVAPTRAELDLKDRHAVARFVREVRPRWIINPAAYTAVDAAETDAATAYAINRDAVQALGEEAVQLGAALIHISTDYVFSGEGTTPWKETDETDPLGVYGASKLAGEQALTATRAPHLIFRTSWVYGASGRNFLRTILRAATQREELRIVADQHGAPTWSRDLAEVIVRVMTRCEAQAQGNALAEIVSSTSGIYHAAAQGETTWFGFADRFLKNARKLNPTEAAARLVPILTTDYPTPAKRPFNSRLNCNKLQRTFELRMPRWEESTDKVIAQVLGQSVGQTR